MNEWEWHLLEDKPAVCSAVVKGVEVAVGDRVRLCPQGKKDIFDLALDGKTAIVEAMEQDYEGKVHFAVVIEDDPGKDIGLLRQPGHRFFFGAEEIEPVGSGERKERAS